MRSFTHDGLSLSFHNNGTQQVSPRPKKITEEQIKAQADAAKEAALDEKIRDQENQLDLLLVTDPLKYEQMITSDELIGEDETQVQH